MSSGSPSRFLSLSLSLSLSYLSDHPDLSVVWPQLTCARALLHAYKSIHLKCIASTAAAVVAVVMLSNVSTNSISPLGTKSTGEMQSLFMLISLVILGTLDVIKPRLC